MTPETETPPPDAGRNVRENSDAETTRAPDIMIKSKMSNGGRGCRQGGHAGRGGQKGRGKRFNRPVYTSFI